MRLLSAALLLLLALPAAGHPLPNQRFDRTIDVRLSPAGVVVQYTLDMNEWTMVLDGKKILSDADLAKVTGLRDYAPIYAGRKGVLVADNLRATIDGQPVTFKIEKTDPTPEKDHLRFRFTLKGDRPVPAGKKVGFAFEDQNFEAESGKVALSLHLDSAFMVHDLDEPAGLRGKSPLELKPGEEKKQRRCTAVVELPPAKEASGGRQPPVATPPAADPGSQQGADAPRSPEPPRGFLADLFDRGLVALFDSTYGLGILLLAAAVFGMGHAFTPGHGKTLVAAYLVGEKGTVRHAFVLGFTTTVAHTGSVIAVAAVLAFLYRDGVPSTAQGWLQLAGGGLIFLVGLWLLARRVQGKADHVHIGGSGHHHHGPGGHHHGPDCDHTHDHDHHHHHHAESRFGWWRVVLLGIGGGIIPCWDAVMLLFVAISAGRLTLAVPLLLAFSVGLAAVLVMLGVGVVLAHRAGAGRFGDQKWFQALPVVSSVLLVGMGLWLARDGVQRLIAADKAAAAEVRG